MPTVPARNSILLGRRVFPFRHWHKRPGLVAKPGWQAPARLDDMFTSVLARAGWWPGYVTDNPFLGFAAPYESFRRSFDVFVRHGGQIGGLDRPVDQDNGRSGRLEVRPTRGKPRKCEAFRRAAEGIRTLDLLHGKQNVRSRASQESPGKEAFPSYRWSALLPSFSGEIAGVSGLKPDW